MRFCQVDGTPLVADEPVDPYKTMVARPEDIAAAIPQDKAGSNDDILQLPDEQDSVKTMYASEDEIRREMGDEQVIDIPPLSEPAPEPPKFSEPSLSPPSFGEMSTSSPFDAAEPHTGLPETPTSPSIPSPFGEPKAPTFEPQFKDPEPVFSQSAGNPFDMPKEQDEWSAPPAPIGQDRSFSPPAAGAAGGSKNQTLAIVSLITGILSLFCCGWFIPGIAAVVMGFMAKGKADKDPANFGGRGLAMGGIITGVISVILGIIVVILYVFTGVLSGIANM